MKSLNEFIRRSNSIFDFVLENRIINFGEANPNYGHCVILAGGAASGKGFIQKKMDIDAKTFDVDKLKGMYRDLARKGKIDDEAAKEWDFANSEDTADAHGKVSSRRWKYKDREKFVADKKNAKHLPNIIFDMVCGDIDAIEEIIELAKPLGYKITLVWVVTNVETAKISNACRGIGEKDDRRSVPDKILEKGHKGAYKTITDIFTNKYPEINKGIDYAWYAFGTGLGHKMEGEYAKSPCNKVKKDDSGNFIFDKSVVDNFLKEQQPWDWKTLDKLKNSDNEYDKEKFDKICKMNEEVKNHYSKGED